MIEIKDPKEYFKIIQRIKHIGLEQSEYWYQYKKSKKKFVFYVDSLTDTSVAILGTIYKLPFIGEILRIQDGPVYQENITQKKFNTFFSYLMKKYEGIEIDSTHPYSTDFEVAIRRVGFLRPSINKRCPLTICIDPCNKKPYGKNWKQNLKKNSQYEMKFVVSNKSDEDIELFVKLFTEMKDMKNISYGVDFKNVKNLLKGDKTHMFFAYCNNTPVAARVISIDKLYAFDIHAANSSFSRDCGGTYFLMDEIFKFLSQFNILFFDFGRIAPGKTKLEYVSHFKETSKGIYVQYNGEWIWYKKKAIRILLNFYYKYLLKIKGY